MPGQRVPFLTATWRNLALLSCEVDSTVLRPYQPHGVELDSWQGKHLITMVGLQFLDARVLGVPVPFHRSYPQVNLRFYVRRWSGGSWRPGVVFIKQMVPKRLVAAVARRVYQEKFTALPMRSLVESGPGTEQVRRVSYQWFTGLDWNRMSVSVSGDPAPSGVGSLEEFVAERYYGYNSQRDGSTMEYQIEHPRWRVWRAYESELDCDAAGVYGPEFAESLGSPPLSAILAEGSPVAVHKGARLHGNRD